MSRIEIQVAGVLSSAALLDDAAPRTVNGLLALLPIVDRTIPTQWSGRAWRTEHDHVVVPDGSEVENVADRLAAGDIIYYPRLHKIGVAYGDAKWLGPFMLPREVSLIGRIDRNLDAFVEECMRIVFEGPRTVRLARVTR